MSVSQSAFRDGRRPGTAGEWQGRLRSNVEEQLEYGRRSGTEEGNNNDGQVETGGEKSKMRPDPQL